MKNIHILPTNKPSRLVKIYNDVNRETFTLKLDVEVNDSFKEYVNIYITSDEEIKKGDWVLNPIYKTVYKWIKNSDIYFDRIDAKKIILTTDQDLINDGVQDIDNEFLEWFVKNPSCESVEVENKKLFDGFLDPEYGSSKWRFEYKVIIPKEESKQELSLKINDEFLDTTSKEILYTLMEEFDNLVTENSSEETLEDYVLDSDEHNNLKSSDGTYLNFHRQSELLLKGAKLGAKWQQEKMYSEEDMIMFADFFHNYKELLKKEKWEILEISKEDVFKKWKQI